MRPAMTRTGFRPDFGCLQFSHLWLLFRTILWQVSKLECSNIPLHLRREDLPSPWFSKFTRGSSVFHTSMRNKQVEFNPYIYTLSKLYRFGYEISVF